MNHRFLPSALLAGAGASLAIHLLLGGWGAGPPSPPVAADLMAAPAPAGPNATVPPDVPVRESTPGEPGEEVLPASTLAAPPPRAHPVITLHSPRHPAAGTVLQPAAAGDIAGAVAALALARGPDSLLRALSRVEDTLAGSDPPASTDSLVVLRADALLEALALASDPLARQNLIFQVAARVPPNRSFPVLRRIRDGEDPEDAADALAALAFRGDPAAGRDWVAMAETAPPLDVRILADGVGDLEPLVRAGRRDLLRSWRCVEALHGRPYFGVRMWPGGDGAPPPEDGAVARLLLPSWIRFYDGHPGSDDMAYRLAIEARNAGDRVEAARWASRAAALPDQDMTRGAVVLLVALAEFSPLDDGLLAALPHPREPGLSRDLLAYVRLRRTAAERGFAEAGAEAGRLAWTEPGLAVSRAWSARWAEAPPRGLDSGEAPLSVDDPLRRVEGERADEAPLRNPARVEWMRWEWPVPEDAQGGAERERWARRDDLRRLPGEEPVRLPARRLAFQMRCWDTVAALERRAAAEGDGDRRADLLYKAAALLYHERDALAPVYAAWKEYRPGLPEPLRLVVPKPGQWLPTEEGTARAAAMATAWVEGTLAPALAAARFEEIRDRYPFSPVAAKAAYSAGLAHQRVSEDRTHGPLDRVMEAVRADHLRAAVAAFEACARERPGTSLGRTAEDVAHFWRKARARLWE